MGGVAGYWRRRFLSGSSRTCSGTGCRHKTLRIASRTEVADPAAKSGRYLMFRARHSSMQEVRLTIRKRAFPSRGRVRLNIAHLADLSVKEGENADLISEVTGRSVTTTVIAATMVPQGQVRVSVVDLAALGLDEGGEVLLRKTPPLKEKLKKAADDAGAALSKSAASVDRSVAKAAGSVKKGAVEAQGRIGRAAKQTAKDVKNAVKKAAGDDTL